MAKKQEYTIGCPDPFSVAEEVAGERINWTKKKDDIDALAECFGITKEGYLSDDSPLSDPYLAVNDEGHFYHLSEEEAEKRLVDFLEKHARPEKRKRKKASAGTESAANAAVSAKARKLEVSEDQEPTQAQRRKRAVNVLLKKSEADSPKQVKTKAATRAKLASEASGKGSAESDDGPHTPSGTEWTDRGYFFNEIPLWSDVCQNNIGDCYFLAALCSVAYVNPFYIQNKAALRTVTNPGTLDVKYESPWHVIDFYVPNSSSYESSIAWSDKKKSVQHVVVSEEILVNSSTGYTYGACGPKEKQLRNKGSKITGKKEDWDACWPAVYEKAYAKFLERTTSDCPNMFSGDSDDDSRGVISGLIRGGFADAALKEIMHTEEVESKSLDKLTADEIWKIAQEAEKHPTCATIFKYTKKRNGEDYHYSKAGSKAYYMETLGLYISHVYSILGCYIIDNIKYIVVRNPHGRNLDALKNNPKVYHKSWGFMNATHADNLFHNWYSIERKLHGSDDPKTSQGIFLLELDEFKRVFCTIEYYTGSSFINYL